jgi:hypothetical protein
MINFLSKASISIYDLQVSWLAAPSVVGLPWRRQLSNQLAPDGHGESKAELPAHVIFASMPAATEEIGNEPSTRAR